MTAQSEINASYCIFVRLTFCNFECHFSNPFDNETNHASDYSTSFLSKAGATTSAVGVSFKFMYEEEREKKSEGKTQDYTVMTSRRILL